MSGARMSAASACGAVVTLVLVVALACTPGQVLGQAAVERPTVIAIVGARVWTGTGTAGTGEPELENATIVIRGDRIESVTPGERVPEGARRVDAQGALVTPGFIAVGAALGLVEIAMERATSDTAPDGDGTDPVRAAFTAADAINPRSTLIPVARLGGLTAALSVPEGGLVSGTSSFFDLAGTDPASVVQRPMAALHVDLGDDGVASAGGALPATFSRLRELVSDARLFAERRALYDRRGLRELGASAADLERIGQVLAGRMPLVVRVSRADSILRVLAWARSERVRLVLSGVEEGWKVADAIAAAEAPVIIEPLSNLPATFASAGARLDNAALLSGAGVRVLIGARDPHGLSALRQEAGNAVANGLDRDVALRALTVEPARTFGVENDYGTIAVGKVASLVIWNGDPFETTTYPTQIFVRGRPIRLRSRQTLLLERYRDLPLQPGAAAASP